MYAGLMRSQEKPAGTGLLNKDSVPGEGYAGDPYFCGIMEAHTVVAVCTEVDRNPIQNQNY